MNDERIVLIDSGLSALKNTISDLIYELSVIEAEDEQSIKQIGVLFKETTAVEKEMESLRKFYVDPLNDTVKKINAIFKAELKELQDVIDEKKTEIAKYHARITMEAKKRAEEEQKALYADVPEEFPIKTEVVPQIPKLSEIATGMKTVTVKTWRLVDIKLVPREYLMLNEKMVDAIRKSMAVDDKSHIPGIVFETEVRVSR